MNKAFIIYPIPPFSLEYTVWALRRRNKNLIDRWGDKRYTRLFVIDNKPIKVLLEQNGTINDPEILVSTNKNITNVAQEKITKLLELMLCLKRDLHDFYNISNQDPHLKPLVIQFIGLKPPRFPPYLKL